MAVRIHLMLILAALWSFSSSASSGASAGTNAAGPTLRFKHDRAESPTNRVAEFMYFVPLISKEPVAVIESPGNSQYARLVSTRRAFTAQSFTVNCEFEFAGEGHQQNIFDHTAKIQRRTESLKKGEPLRYQLAAIDVEGSGNVTVQISGTVSNQVATVTEVQMRFGGRSRNGPVTIDLQDYYYADGQVRTRNEIVAKVSSLIFRRQGEPPKMEVTLASLKPKDAGGGFWQNFKAGIKGATANLFIKPMTINPAGNETMLDFGQALVAAAPEFTFPLATNRLTGKAGN